MNMDFYGYFQYGDSDAVYQFAMAHFFAHQAEATAIAAQFGRNINVYNVSGQDIADDWVQLMAGQIEAQTRAMYDWLQSHNDSHVEMLQLMGTGGLAKSNAEVDLSLADFKDPDQMYDWLTLHQQLHQYEQTVLKLS